MNDIQTSPLIPSATAIILHQNSQQTDFNVLLLKRNAKLVTHGGSWVFPGGKFDPQDYHQHKLDVLKTPYHTLDNSERLLIAKTAAIREASEEADVVLAPDALQLCSTWLTPETMKKRFDAFFFITESDTDDIKIDGSEIHDFLWITPEEAIARQYAGEITLPPPTFVTLSACL